jgi:Dolichyl-phosphate-mannose-protein mannosyltransferase
MAQRVVSLAGWLVIAAAALELTAREVARRPLLPHALGGAWSPVALVVAAAVAAALVFSLSARPGRARANGTLLLFSVLFSAGVAAQLALGARLQSDGFYYFAYLRSLAFDRDVEFANDYKLLGLGDKTHLFQPTRTGHAQSAWTIGPAILWAPFFAAGHVVAKELSDNNPDVSTNGISYPYRQSVCIAGLVYGLLGCWFMYRLASRLTERRFAAVATVMTVAGSFMLWYLVKEPSMTHAPSMALVAGFTWMWAATRQQRTTTHWALVGLVAGLMTLVRWQNAIFAILPAWDAAALLLDARRTANQRAVRETIAHGILFTAAATFAFLPQMLAWRAIYGSWLAVSPVGPQIRFTGPRIIDILWSSRNGLFSTAPALYLGAIGLLLFARLNPATGLPMIAAVAAMTYFNACIQDWWGSAGYGGRRFDGTLPFFCVGLAYLCGAAVRFVRRSPGVVLAAAAAALIVWNLTMMSAAQAGILRIGESVSFGDAMAAQTRAFHAWFGNPFTYPVSLIYALRNGVSPGRYDLLSTNRFLADPGRSYGGLDVGGAGDEWLIGEGWHAPEREGSTTFRWASQHADFVIPLDHAATLRVQFRLHAFSFPGAPPQMMKMIVNGHEFGPVPIDGGWHSTEFLADRSVWRTGVNRLRLDFAAAHRPVDVGLGTDPRVLAAAVDYFRVAKPE